MELRDALLKVIHEEFGGSRKDFALAVDEEPTTVSRWITGKVSLPKAEARRKIAKVLGVRHVDILVMAGELSPAEASSVAPACERSEADRIMERLDPESREVALLVLRRFLKTTEAERATRTPLPAAPHD